MTVLNTGKPFFVFKDISKLLVYRPIIVTSSPGRAISIKSPVRITSYNIRKKQLEHTLERGIRPAGTEPGDSCNVIF